jgi:hypothetical protein
MKKKNELSSIAKKMAKKGGATTLKKHGKKHYKAMAKARWAKSKITQ